MRCLDNVYFVLLLFSNVICNKMFNLNNIAILWEKKSKVIINGLICNIYKLNVLFIK